MWLAVIKILVLVHLVSLSYQNVDYGDSRWRSRFYATSTPSWHNKNSYRYQVMAKATTSTTTTTTERPHHIRHSGYNSRYPRLDNVLNRLGSYYGTTKKPTTKSWDNYYRRTSSDVNRDLDDNYEDLDYNDDDIDDLDKEDNISDYEDKWGNEDEDKNDEDYQEEEEDIDEDEEDVSRLFDDHWQAEEATEAPASSSSLTEYKWRHYGTRSRVEESRRMQMQRTVSSAENAADAAVSHYLKVASEGKCRTPIPKVLSVQSEYPSPGKTYIPHCTILHRCSEDSGCCQNHAKQCGPKNQTIVHLYFYSHMIYESPRVEKLSFINHTECDCLDKSQLDTPSNANTITSAGHMVLKSGIHPPPESIRRCKCPGQFVPRHRFNLCTCDCSDSNQDCERMQRGKEYFSLKDRLCIKSGQCSMPICEYGSYLTDVGRCPRKQEKLEAYANVRASH